MLWERLGGSGKGAKGGMPGRGWGGCRHRGLEVMTGAGLGRMIGFQDNRRGCCRYEACGKMCLRTNTYTEPCDTGDDRSAVVLRCSGAGVNLHPRQHGRQGGSDPRSYHVGPARCTGGKGGSYHWWGERGGRGHSLLVGEAGEGEGELISMLVDHHQGWTVPILLAACACQPPSPCLLQSTQMCTAGP